jgi:hypothetical protein
VAAPAAPTFGAGPSPAGYQATTANPFVGTTLAGKYAPTATDPRAGDVSANIKTYLTATNELINVATYLFPLGSTSITNRVTNSLGVTATQTAPVVVTDSTKPVVSVAGGTVLVIQAEQAPPRTVNYANKVRPARARRARAARLWGCGALALPRPRAGGLPARADPRVCPRRR